jgi:hypothetical protein
MCFSSCFKVSLIGWKTFCRDVIPRASSFDCSSAIVISSRLKFDCADAESFVAAIAAAPVNRNSRLVCFAINEKMKREPAYAMDGEWRG